MSLYNMIMGVNPLAPALIALADLEMGDIPRFRDAFVSERKDEVVIGIYTRVGGGNRSAYQDEIDVLRAHPRYITDVDDDFDSTYATFYFRIEPALGEALRARGCLQAFHR